MGITLDGTNGIDLDGTELKLDADADTSITADTDDQIDIRIAGVDCGTLTQSSGKLTVNSTGTNLSFAVGGTVELNTDGTQFYPQTDDSHNLGTSSLRFKDLYLSSGVFLGGTTAANELTDYEEGTFTPIWRVTGGANSFGYTNQTGRYTKIGNRVYGLCRVTSTSHSGSGGGVSVQGFPFTATNVTTAYHHFTFGHFTGFSYTGFPYGYVNSNTIYADLQVNNNGSISAATYPGSTTIDIIFSFMYETDS